MKTYQDTETGKIYAFEDNFDPVNANNRNIPKTLTATVKLRPDDSYVWYQGNWIKREAAPAGYTPPISSGTSYNPAWMAYLRPYSAIHRDASSGLNITLDQINTNSYDGSKLAEAVSCLPLGNQSGIPALVSYDGAIAIPQCSDFPNRVEAVRKLNELLCSLLLGGIHVEVLRSQDLVVGTLHEKTKLFAFTPGLHTALQLNMAALQDLCAPLIFPRLLMVDDLRDAFHQGQQVIRSIPNFTPYFLLNGYTDMVYRNNSDALSNLWIAVEELTELLWSDQYMKNLDSYSSEVTKEHAELKGAIKKNQIFAKHILLKLTKIISEDCYIILDCARNKRNELAHKGDVPSADIVEELWRALPELIEKASGVGALGLRRLGGGTVENWDSPAKTDFDEWVNLAQTL